MAVGREEIRTIAVGLEMRGLEGWTYPYQFTMIDDRQGLIIGSGSRSRTRPVRTVSPYVVAGFGGSLFGYADGHFTWQRDFYDHMNVGTVFLEMAANGQLSAGMTERIETAMTGVRAPPPPAVGDARAAVAERGGTHLMSSHDDCSSTAS